MKIKIPKKFLVLTLIALMALAAFVLRSVLKHESRADKFLATNSAASNFATGGVLNGTTYGYTSVKLDVGTCQKGRDAVYFGFGHTEFLVAGKSGSSCRFRYGTEIENPNWNGALNYSCQIPSNITIELSLSNNGMNFSSIEKYCSSSR